MTRSLLGACVAVASLLTTGLAAQTSPPPPVVLVGCVLQGTEPDTFLLTGFVAGNPRATDAPARDGTPSLYWLSTTKNLKKRVNQQVEVIGTVETSELGTLKVETDRSNTPDAKVALKAGLETVQAVTDADARPVRAVTDNTPVGTSGQTVGTSGQKASVELKKPLQRLKVKSIVMVSPTCPPAGS